MMKSYAFTLVWRCNDKIYTEYGLTMAESVTEAIANVVDDDDEDELVSIKVDYVANGKYLELEKDEYSKLVEVNA